MCMNEGLTTLVEIIHMHAGPAIYIYVACSSRFLITVSSLPFPHYRFLIIVPPFRSHGTRL